MTYSASLTATEVPLNKGLVTIVDADDFDWLSRWKWQISTAGYARRNPEGAERHTGPNSILMHRVLLPPPSGLFVDHINGDKLDNRRANLRICDKRQNAWNTTSCRGASAFKGVSWCGMTGRWSAHIRADGKSVRLGRFLTEEEAARAYDAAAMRVQGEFARLNFPMREAG